MKKLYTSKTFLKMAGGRTHTIHLTPGSAPGYKLQKPSHEPGIFQSLGTISFILMNRPFQCKLLNSQLLIAYALARFCSNYV